MKRRKKNCILIQIMIQIVVEILVSVILFSLVVTVYQKQESNSLSLNRSYRNKYDLYQLNQQYDKKDQFYDSSKHSLNEFGQFITNRIL